jgi:CheY-like chemotaxis protein
VAHAHAVPAAADGFRGLELVRAERPDVALVDLGLPGLDGYAVARAIRKDAFPGKPYLVAVTGYGQPEDRRRALEAGFDAHLVKPVAEDTLAETLAAARRQD